MDPATRADVGVVGDVHVHKVENSYNKAKYNSFFGIVGSEVSFVQSQSSFQTFAADVEPLQPSLSL